VVVPPFAVPPSPAVLVSPAAPTVEPPRESYRLRPSPAASWPSAQDLMFSERAMIGGTWAAASAIVELNTAEDEGNPTLTSDELVIMFSRVNASGDEDVYYATRAQ
jgi:hypothetical protein